MKKVLVVEDEIIIAMGVSLLLEADGYEVRLAPDGRKGLELVAEWSPDLIITDFMMPRMDGLAMIGSLREAGVTTPVLLMSAISEGRLPGNPKASYDAYLSKPARDEDLRAAVRSLLRE